MTTTSTARLDQTKLLRAMLTLQGALVFVQFVTAGLLLSLPHGRVAHSAGSFALWLASLAHLVVAILAWRPGGGSPRALYVGLGFVALVTAQALLGVFRLTALHVPLAAVLLAATLTYLVRLRAARKERS